MSAAAAALAPVFLLILAGVLLRRFAPISDAGWEGFGYITYFIFTPALIIETLARADMTLDSLTGVGAALALTVAATGLLVVAFQQPLIRQIGGPSFTALFQGAARWNAFVALAVGEALYGETGLTLIAVGFIVLMPGLNAASVWLLTRHGTRATAAQTLTGTLRAVAANPFVWGCAVGFGLWLVQDWVPDGLLTATDLLGRAALGAALLMVGAGLHLRALMRFDMSVGLSCVLKLLVAPTIAYAICRALGLGTTETAVVLIATSVPTSMGSYILAQRMGGDAPLMARIITAQTLLAFLTMPLFIGLAV